MLTLRTGLLVYSLLFVQFVLKRNSEVKACVKPLVEAHQIVSIILSMPYYFLVVDRGPCLGLSDEEYLRAISSSI